MLLVQVIIVVICTIIGSYALVFTWMYLNKLINYVFFKKKKIVSEVDNNYKILFPEKIVDNFGEALSRGSNGIARYASLLGNSKEEIKQALKDYVISLKNNKKLTEEKYKI